MSVPNWRTKPQDKIIYYAPDGTSYLLHSPPDRVVVGMSGWGLSPHEAMTTRGPYQQGDTVVAQRLAAREISMTVHHNGTSRTDYWGNRGSLVNIFRENRTNLNYPTSGKLRFIHYENGDPIIRELNVFFNDGFVFQPNNLQYWDGYAVRETILFVAHDPIVYDPTAITVTAPTLTEGLVLPMTFPFVLGAWGGYSTINYTGTWETYPTFTITGPATGVSIYNQTIDKWIQIATPISGGETVTVSLEYNNKTVTSDVRGDITYAAIDSDLATFSIKEDPLVSGGTNMIYYYVEGYEPSITTITMTYYNRYRGI